MSKHKTKKIRQLRDEVARLNAEIDRLRSANAANNGLRQAYKTIANAALNDRLIKSKI